MILDLADTTNPERASSKNVDSPKVLRIWYNTLLEYKDGQVKIIKSYSRPAKDSDVQRYLKEKMKKATPKTLEAPRIGVVEEY